MKDMIGTLEALYMDALLDASENFDAGVQKITTEDSGGVKYQLKGYSQHQVDNWASSKSIVIYENERQLRQFISDARNGINLSKKMYFGAITADLAARIKKDTGLDVDHYNCTLRASEVRKIFADHGNEETEAPRGQRAIEEDDIVAIPQIIQSPDEIRLSDKLFEGKPVIEFVKTINGKTTVAAYVSAKHLDLTVQTMYSGKNKGNLAAAAGDQAPANTPEAHDGTVPNSSIRNPGEVVNKKISDRDSAGNQLSEGQQEYFRVSKERDDQGRLRVMYRGDSMEVTVFDRKKSSYSNLYGRGFYFTNSASHAGQYGQATAYYLNITNPVSTTDCTITREQMRKFLEAVAENEDDYSFENYGYGATVESVLEGLYTGKSDFAMLYDVSQTAIGDMVEAVELFNKTNGTNYDGFILDTETVIFNSAQAKRTDNRNPTANPDTRFSLREPVERTKNLVAVHNLSEEKLLKSLKLGGLPMPSIAIIRAQDGHGEFGDISLVFGKDTVDPEVYRANKLYSGDAWTPMYPKVDYKPSEKVLRKVKERISGLVPYEVQSALGSLMFDTDNARSNLDRYNGNMVEAYKQNDAMKYAYLKDTGSDISLPMKEADLYRYGDVSNAAVRYFSGKLVNGLQTVELYRNMHARDVLQDRTLTEAVADAQNFDVLRTLEKGSDEYLKYERNPVFSADEVSFADVDNFLSASRKLLTNGVQQTVDRKAAKELIRDAVDQTEYESWLEKLFSGVVEKEGIRNNKDYFTPSGNRRSFEALHYEHNLENVIKAMRADGEKGIGNGFGGASIFGASTTEYSSIEDMKQASDRLQMMPYEEYQELRKQFTDRFLEIVLKLPNQKNSFSATDSAAEVLTEAVAKYKTRSGIANYLRRELKGWATYSEQVVDDLIALVNDIRKMPTRYFEAKPRRAVSFEEVTTAIVPDSISNDLRTKLEDMGIKFVEYPAGDEEARKMALNSLEGVRFSNRDPDRQKVQEALEKENAKLREDVTELRELVKLQRQVTDGTKFTKTSVEAAAISLKQSANAKGDTKELAKLLNGLYEHIASTKELTWEGVKEQAQGAVDWLWEHIDRKGKPSEYAQEILGQLSGTRVRRITGSNDRCE